MSLPNSIYVRHKCNDITEAIGNTPLIKLNRITAALPCPVYAKLESINPGLSAKDRIALSMIESAEQKGKLCPGGTVIESTSGNTGFSVAMICAVKGYKCILCTTQKISDEKLIALQALGAEVKICPTNVKADDSQSYYSVAKKLHADIANSIYLNQYYNPDNTAAHYASTGPEIWQQTEGQITHYVAACGTGGTLCGAGKFLKEQNENVKIVGIDAYGSVLQKYHETGEFDEKEIYPYKLEAVGKNIIPDNVDFDLVDKFIKVKDDVAAHRTRELAKSEGILVGYSAGAVVEGVLKMAEELNEDDTVVVLFSDHGSKYFGKVFSDDWMKDQGFL